MELMSNKPIIAYMLTSSPTTAVGWVNQTSTFSPAAWLTVFAQQTTQGLIRRNTAYRWPSLTFVLHQSMTDMLTNVQSSQAEGGNPPVREQLQMKQMLGWFHTWMVLVFLSKKSLNTKIWHFYKGLILLTFSFRICPECVSSWLDLELLSLSTSTEPWPASATYRESSWMDTSRPVASCIPVRDKSRPSGILFKAMPLRCMELKWI